jgi:protein TonB
MKISITIVLFFLSLNSFSQDNEDLAGAYFNKAKKSLVENDTEKVVRYLQKTKEYFGGITKEEVAVFGANFYYKTKNKILTKEYLKAFFELNTDKTSESYKTMLLLYTDYLDSLENDESDSVKSQKSIVKVVNKKPTLKSLYAEAHQLFENEEYQASLKSANSFFGLKPSEESTEYQDMVLLIVNSKEKIEELGLDEEIIEKVEVIDSFDEVLEKKEIVEEDVSFMIIEDVPVFPGCEGTKSELKDCFSRNIQTHFARKFNSELPNELGLSPGRKKVFISFKIDKSGRVIDVFSRAPHPKIKEEVIRVMMLLPNMKPGMQRGKPVGVKYSIPFTLIVEGNSDTKKEKN